VVALDLDSRSSSSLYIPAGTLQAGATYRFTLTATNADMLEYVGQASVTVRVLEEVPQAVVESGRRYLSRYAPIELDGSLSSADDVTYRWTCTWVGGTDLTGDDHSCPAERYLDTPAYHTAHVVLPASALPPGDWRFTLTVSRDNLSATADQLVTIGWDDAPTVFVRLARVGRSSTHGHSYDNLPANELIQFSATVASPLGRAVADLVWSVTDGDITNLTAPGVTRAGSDITVLTFNPDVLTPGAQYRLRLSASYAAEALQADDWAENSGLPWAASTPQATGWTEVTFSIGDIPWGGSCAVDLTQEGLGYASLVATRCLGFDTSARQLVEGGPIFVHHYARHSSDPLGGLFPLGSHTSVAAGRFDTYLPATGSGSLTLYARVFDRSGSSAYLPISPEPRLLDIASGVIVRTSSNDSFAMTAEELLRSSVVQGTIQRGRVDLVPTLLYSILFELNSLQALNSTNPFAPTEELVVRTEVFEVLRTRVALERSEDAVTVQAHLLYLLSGGDRTLVEGGLDKRSPSSVFATRRNLAAPASLGLQLLQNLRELAAASPRSDDLIVRLQKTLASLSLARSLN
jgi:hypothetical protein